MDLSLFVSILAWFVAAFVSGLCGIGAAAIATAIQHCHARADRGACLLPHRLFCWSCHELEIFSLLSLEDSNAHVWRNHPRLSWGASCSMLRPIS